MNNIDNLEHINQRISEINNVLSSAFKYYSLITIICVFSFLGDVKTIIIGNINLNLTPVLLILLPITQFIISYYIVTQILYRNHLFNLFHEISQTEDNQFSYLLMPYSTYSLGLVIKNDTNSLFSFLFYGLVEVLSSFIFVIVPAILTTMYWFLIKELRVPLAITISLLYILTITCTVEVYKMLKKKFDG